MTKNLLRYIGVALLGFFPLSKAPAQDFYHPELRWTTIETEHFLVHYHDGAERTGKVVAKIAEEIYEPITSLYGHEPTSKVHFIIRDHDDISNGAAYFYDNKIEIYAPSMDFEFRGTHNWLRNVVTHEFTHIVQIQTSMRFGRRVPAVYVQWLGYESERRPDVLYGYPNVIASYPLAGTTVPAWFAEGVAQFNDQDLLYDSWDTHRDMILRSYALDDNLLTWEQMGVFGKTSLGNESSYNAGFAFIRYLVGRYGQETLAEISRNLSTLDAFTIDKAIARAVGKDGEVVYNEWREQIKHDYAVRVESIRAQLRQGEPLLPDDDDVYFHSSSRTDQFSGQGQRHAWGCCRMMSRTGFANLYPTFSPDGKKVAYTSTKRGDYFSQSSLFVYELETKSERKVHSGIQTRPSWSPDGKKLYYGKASRKNAHWSYQHDLYEFDLETEEERRLTTGLRATNPAISPDGTTLVFVVQKDGTSNLARMNLDGTEYKAITSFTHGEQVYAPSWSPTGDRIVVDYSTKDGRDIAMLNAEGGELQLLVSGEDDSRTPVFTPDGTRILFSSDRTGIFNLYTYDMADGAVRQQSNVLGGAFLPSMNAEGTIVYAWYCSGGYKIALLTPETDLLLAANTQYQKEGTGRDAAPHHGRQVLMKRSSFGDYDDTTVPDFPTRPYRAEHTGISFLPFLRFDNYNPENTLTDIVRPGMYFYSSEVLEKTGVFGGIAFNRRLERDLFIQFFYRGRLPVLYHLGLEPVASLEAYNVTRKTRNVISLPASTIPIDLTYDLLEFDVALNQPFVSQFSNVEFRYAHSRYTAAIESFLNVETSSIVPGSSDLYLIANSLSLTFSSESILRSTTSEINPVGRKVSFRIGRELNKFNGDGEYVVTSIGLQPVYKAINYTQTELKWKEYIAAPFSQHTITASLRGGSILGPAVDEFFDFYAGGLIGMKGYPYYAISGNEIAVLGLAYRFPLVSNLDFRVLQIYFDKLYMSIYGDIGHAWSGKVPPFRDFKKDAGIELRLEAFSFYSYPTRIFINASYGFDRFDRFVRSRNEVVTYGREWRFYLGVLFGFDLD